MVVMSTAPKHRDLKHLSREELIQRYDAEAERTVVGTGYYLEELRYRETLDLLKRVVRSLEAIAESLSSGEEKPPEHTGQVRRPQ